MANTIFRGFLKQLILYTPKQYYNESNTIQSSVGLIFKFRSLQPSRNIQEIINAEYEDLQLLFTQRAGYEKDKNAYNVVFPGGQCDNNQSDLVACKRQLYQQINLKVDDQCVYIGQIPSNFYYLQKRGKKMFITCHVWCMRQQQFNWVQKLNPDQLSDSRWVPFKQLISLNNYVFNNVLQFGLIQRMSLKFNLFKNISKKIQNVEMPELNLGMKRNLWGLTLWIWSYVLQMALNNIKNTQYIQNHDKYLLNEIQKQIQHTKKLQIKFNENYLMKYPILGVVKGWHYFYRCRPFTYKKDEILNWKYIIVLILLLVIVYFMFT